jgi:alpha-L-arabinofuranosidase
MNPQGTGPGVPQEAAAWVAYANGDPASTTVIGVDNTGYDWMTVGYWAGLRAGGKMPTDDGRNFLRISHPAPVGVKYWEIGNEIYGNGYYHGNCGWEADKRVPYPENMGTTCTGRKDNPLLAPPVYGMAVKQYAAAMKAVDPTIKIGAVLIGNTEYPDWNAKVLAAACPSFDIAVLHWYGGNVGTGLTSLPSAPEREIPEIFSTVRGAIATPMFGCSADLPVMVTEWGPNSLSGNDLPSSTPDTAPAGSH